MALAKDNLVVNACAPEYNFNAASYLLPENIEGRN